MVAAPVLGYPGFQRDNKFWTYQEGKEPPSEDDRVLTRIIALYEESLADQSERDYTVGAGAGYFSEGWVGLEVVPTVWVDTLDDLQLCSLDIVVL